MGYKKGQSGNPAGRPKLPADIKGARELNKLELDRMLNRMVFLSRPEIKAIASSKNPDSPIIEMIVAQILIKAHEYGDAFRTEFIFSRLMGRVREMPVEEITPSTAGLLSEAKKTFTQFCLDAGYPPPFPKQIEMVDFIFSLIDPRLLLGARGTGKTDYVTILGSAYKIYMDPEWTILVLTKEQKRVQAIITEISTALTKNGVVLEMDNSSSIRVRGLQGKDHSIEGLSIRSGLRGRHPKQVIMDDPVTEEDVSEATRSLVQRKYNEAMKLTANIGIIGQPAHAHDLYGMLRPILKLMEVPHGMIPELDHDLEAMKLAGVDERSISMSYHLKIPDDGQSPFAHVNFIDQFPVGTQPAVAFIDPSHEGGDFTAITIFKQHFHRIVVRGHVWKKAWNHCLEEMVPHLKACNVKKVCFETNALGDQPIIMLRQLLDPLGIGVNGRRSNNNKHSRIMAAGAFAHMIDLSKDSDRAYTDQVVKYEYKAKNDDAPDSLATGMEWIGLIRGKQ